MHKYLKIFFIIVTIGTIAEIINTIIRNLGMPNGISMNAYTLLNCLIFIFLFKETKTFSFKLIKILLLIFAIGSIYFMYLIGRINEMNSHLVVFTNFILMLLSAATLIKMTNGDLDDLFSHPMFWISANLLMFSTASNIVYSLFPNSLFYSNNEFYNQIWDVHGVLNIIYNLLLAYVFICHLRIPSFTQS